MRGETAQLIALCLKLNSVAGAAAVGSSFAENSSMKFCRVVTFTHLKRKLLRPNPARVTMATGPDDWMKAILSMGLKRCYLSCAVRPENKLLTECSDDWQTTAFAGGGNVWALTTQFADGHDTSWIPVWSYIGGDAPWDVEYQGFNEVFPDESSSVEAGAEQLKAALIDIRDFARDMDLHWAKTFEGALARLAGEEGPSYLGDMSSAGALTPEAEQLMHACQASWVFGGMGSWNDIYMVGDTYMMDCPRYAAVSAALFDAINQSLVAATNSRFP